MGALKIRKAQITDSRVVAELWHKYELYEHNLDPRITVGSEMSYRKHFEEILSNKSSLIALAELESQIVGIIDYITYKKGMLRVGSLGNVFVLEDYRGKGIGSKLIEYAMDKLRNKKCNYIISGVRVNNSDAQNFWKKRGFTIDEESIVNYSMRKELRKV